MPPAFPCAQSTSGRQRPPKCAPFAASVGYPLILKTAQRRGRRRHEARPDNGARARTGPLPEYHLDQGQLHCRRGIHRRTRRLPRHHQHQWRSGPRVHQPLLPQRAGSHARARWISPQIIATNRIDSAGYDEVKRVGPQKSSRRWASAPRPPTWNGFFGSKGLKFSEIGPAAHPALASGTSIAQLNDFDIYKEWALAPGFTAAIGEKPVTPLRLRHDRICAPIAMAASPATKASDSHRPRVRRLYSRCAPAQSRHTNSACGSRLHG